MSFCQDLLSFSLLEIVKQSTLIVQEQRLCPIGQRLFF